MTLTERLGELVTMVKNDTVDAEFADAIQKQMDSLTDGLRQALGSLVSGMVRRDALTTMVGSAAPDFNENEARRAALQYRPRSEKLSKTEDEIQERERQAYMAGLRDESARKKQQFSLLEQVHAVSRNWIEKNKPRLEQLEKLQLSAGSVKQIKG